MSVHASFPYNQRRASSTDFDALIKKRILPKLVLPQIVFASLSITTKGIRVKPFFHFGIIHPFFQFTVIIQVVVKYVQYPRF
jgi:hypothetical protein